MKNIFWIVFDLIPMIIAFLIHPPLLGFSVGLVLTILILVFQHERFGEVNTLIKVKIFYFLSCLGILLFIPSIHLLSYTQVFVYAILAFTTLLSLFMKKPFTLQYAKKSTDPAFWNHPLFVSTNYWLTVGWAVTFLVSLGFSILYTLQVITGTTGIVLSNLWNILGFLVTFIVPPLVKKVYRNQLHV